MQTDRRLVEHVKNPAQLRADLRGQTNALAFAAGQSRRRPIQSQISQPDSFQKAKSSLNLAQHQSGDLFFALIELDPIESFDGVFDGHRGVVRNASVVDAHCERIGAQALALAFATDGGRNHLFQRHTDLLTGRIIQTVAQQRQSALPVTLVRIQALTKA